MRNNVLKELVNKLWRFDWYTEYSDDYSVTRQGYKNKAELKEYIKNLNLTVEEIEKVLIVLSYRIDANYLESKQWYDCIADQELCSTGNNRHLNMIKGFLNDSIVS